MAQPATVITRGPGSNDSYVSEVFAAEQPYRILFRLLELRPRHFETSKATGKFGATGC